MVIRLFGPAEVRERAEHAGVTPTKKLGQNFVHDANTVRRIVRLAEVKSGENVLEVGPGLGSLTLGLLEAGAHVTAVEIDGRLAGQLSDTAELMGADPAALTVLHHDALRLTERVLTESSQSAAVVEPLSTASAGRESRSRESRDRESAGSEFSANSPVPVSAFPTRLVANLPYNVSVPILLHLLAELPGLAYGVVMVQAEVGERLAAKPGSKSYGSPSVKAAWYGRWWVAGQVSRQVFWPVPNVDSILVAFERNKRAFAAERTEPDAATQASTGLVLPPQADDSALRKRVFSLVDAAFGHRRKMLRQALAGVFGTAVQASTALEAAGIDPTARGEQLSLADFVMLAERG